jgi:hypothetical protein
LEPGRAITHRQNAGKAISEDVPGMNLGPPAVTELLSDPNPRAPSLDQGRFELIRPEQLKAPVISEIADFLDTEIAAHPFQFPRWVCSEKGTFRTGARFYIYREEHQIRWFACCGTLYPLGKLLSPMRGLVITRGPVCADAAIWSLALQALVSSAKEEGYAFIEASPELVPSQVPELLEVFCKNDWKPCAAGRTSLRLDLTKNADQLIAGFRKTTRNEVRRGERDGIRIEKTQNDSEISEFLRIYAEMAQRKGFSADSLQHVRGILRWLACEPKRGTLLLARREERILGGAVVVRTGKRCWYVWGATQKCVYTSVGHLLQWNALLWAKSQGCTEYDFGGYTENATSGPALFKKGFGGDLVRFLEPQRVIVNQRRCKIIEVLSGLR